MNTYTKSIVIGGAVLIAGILGISQVEFGSTPSEETNQTYSLQISDDQKSPIEVLRIVPSENIAFFPEESFTLNDITFEIESEKRKNGESDRYNQLVELKSAVSDKLNELPARPENVDNIDLTKPEPEI